MNLKLGVVPYRRTAFDQIAKMLQEDSIKYGSTTAIWSAVGTNDEMNDQNVRGTGEIRARVAAYQRAVHAISLEASFEIREGTAWIYLGSSSSVAERGICLSQQFKIASYCPSISFYDEPAPKLKPLSHGWYSSSLIPMFAGP